MWELNVESTCGIFFPFKKMINPKSKRVQGCFGDWNKSVYLSTLKEEQASYVVEGILKTVKDEYLQGRFKEEGKECTLTELCSLW